MQDIEELVRVGQLIQSCPYYGTRAALASAEVVTMPYNVLLHKVLSVLLLLDRRSHSMCRGRESRLG